MITKKDVSLFLIKIYKVKNFLKILSISLIRFYQLFISPMKIFLFGSSSCCRFHPTCSNYSILAFKKFGFLKGFYLTICRLLRCHPWHPGGIDYLPNNKNASSKE